MEVKKYNPVVVKPLPKTKTKTKPKTKFEAKNLGTKGEAPLSLEKKRRLVGIV